MSKTIYETDFSEYLPEALRGDQRIMGIAKALSSQLLDVSNLTRNVLIYNRIDELPGDVLDILAYDMHVDWYSKKYPVEVKRDIIKSSVMIHKRMGTKWAVEMGAKTVYGSAAVEEWFEYGGKPYHFAMTIDVSNLRVRWEDLTPLRQQIKAYKNVRSWLEKIVFIDYETINVKEEWKQKYFDYYTSVCIWPCQVLNGQTTLKNLLLNNKWVDYKMIVDYELEIQNKEKITCNMDYAAAFVFEVFGNIMDGTNSMDGEILHDGAIVAGYKKRHNTTIDIPIKMNFWGFQMLNGVYVLPDLRLNNRFKEYNAGVITINSDGEETEETL